MQVSLAGRKHRMRYLVGVLVVSASLAWSLRTTFGEENPPDTSTSNRYGVLCRWIDAKGEVVMAPKLKLPENQKGIVSSMTKRPFVIGTTPEGKAQRPHIVVIEDGLSIEVTVAGRHPDGASIDVTVEESKILDIGTKKIAPDTTIQIPHVDNQKKRIVDFVKYGEVFSIRLGKKHSASRIELMIQADDKTAVPANWTVPAKDDSPNSVNAKQTEIFGEILAGDGVELRCEKEGYSVTLSDSPLLILKNVRLLI